MHQPSSINEIRNAQLAFLKMKHALSSFGKYVPHEVVREMIVRGEDAELGMERCVSCFFFFIIVFLFPFSFSWRVADFFLLSLGAAKMSQFFFRILLGSQRSVRKWNRRIC